MSEIIDTFKAMEAERKRLGWDRYDRFIVEFPDAEKLASSGGFRLRKLDDGMVYHLSRRGEWTLQIYPTNHRLYSDRNRPAPFVGELENFTLTAIIARVIQIESESS